MRPTSEDYFPKGRGLHKRGASNRFNWKTPGPRKSRESRLSIGWIFFGSVVGDEAKRRFKNKQVF